ncbi:MAG: prepilin-type N-terminal cleavage/methylation domain-containing protein [Labilithrix sp.]
MKGRISRRRTRARASGAGYTLIELMVVVILIAMLAMMAAPSMVTARGDRLAFSYARQVADAVHTARTRAAGRGAAHLVVYEQSIAGGDRGRVLVFEGLDGTDNTATPKGPNPWPGCRRPNQWAFAGAWAGGTDATNSAAVVDAVNVNATNTSDIIIKENIRLVARFTLASSSAPGAVDAFALCTTPNGTTYFGSGANASDAIKNMQAAVTPFTDVIEVDVQRHDSSNAPVGLNRRVIIAGAGAPRIKSE